MVRNFADELQKKRNYFVKNNTSAMFCCINNSEITALSVHHISASGHGQHVFLPAAAGRTCPPWLPQPGTNMQVPGAWRALPILHPQQAPPRATSPSL